MCVESVFVSPLEAAWVRVAGRDRAISPWPNADKTCLECRRRDMACCLSPRCQAWVEHRAMVGWCRATLQQVKQLRGDHLRPRTCCRTPGLVHWKQEPVRVPKPIERGAASRSCVLWAARCCSMILRAHPPRETGALAAGGDDAVRGRQTRLPASERGDGGEEQRIRCKPGHVPPAYASLGAEE